jgi:calcineurin-like phosphoesterase family protein
VIFFTADLHFCHEGIIKYRKIAQSEKQLSKHIIAQYNSIVQKQDTCFVIGDFALTSSSRINELSIIRQKLNGKIELIIGNHDTFNPHVYVNDIGIDNIHMFYTSAISGYINDQYIKNIPIFMAHDPAIAEAMNNCIFLCGHVHTLFKTLYNEDKNVIVINCGLDVWNYLPINEQQILNEVCSYPFKFNT